MEETKNQYIPGDLVMTNGHPMGTVNGVVYKVMASDPFRTEFFPESGRTLKGTVILDNVDEDKEGDKGYLFGPSPAWVKHIIPIPIVGSLLRANGWNLFYINIGSALGDGIMLTKYGYSSLFYSVDDVSDGDIISSIIAIDNEVVIRRDIHYLHELQNLLFGLGLSMNFKI